MNEELLMHRMVAHARLGEQPAARHVHRIERDKDPVQSIRWSLGRRIVSIGARVAADPSLEPVRS